jgi:transcription elongation factor GreA
MDGTAITPDGLRRLREELERLTTDGRRAIAERLQVAAGSETNAAENGDYLDAREAQALLERRIALLERRLRTAEVVEPQLGNGRVDVGERVRLRDLESGRRLELELVGVHESDPFSNRVSVASPVGRAILGRRRGQVAEVDAPCGRLRLRILAVETT